MRDRWQNRADTPRGKGTIYWHILMGRYPEVRSLAQKAQNQLADFTGLHMTPLDWLHISTLVVGSTEEVGPDEMARMLDHASDILAGVPPIDITLGRVLYHPEAIMLGVEPTRALDPVLEAARAAAYSVTGRDGYTTSGPGRWVPHMTLCYSTARQSARPIIETLGLEFGNCQARISELTLVSQLGPEREWKWSPYGAVCLQGS
ncbi:2'-5' RNA ligase family protein [Actinomadura chokoriensis]|uniref:2'-5' RNA ligase family protein n=1 Tax=Actinomadura chokoriensis TaxID=454156 RepID=UPI003563A1CB